ncbi:CBS domain-containing protein [Acrocarpospora sp. B8E8]|uniref:CBS domain-containing protein n=1 Tax=Acrocarpospora sp. B8E8 TaxID=3153572 RepID=UPI00325D8C2B
MRVNVRDVMTREPIAVPATMSFKQVASTLVDNKISAVAVLDATGGLVGVISEADLLRKEEFRELYYRECYESPSRIRNDRAPGFDAHRKAHALTAADLMTSPAVTIRPDTSAVRAVRVMDEQRVKRLLVVDDEGRLSGVISRSDLLRLFLRDERYRQPWQVRLRHRLSPDGARPAKKMDARTAAGLMTARGRRPQRDGVEGR